MLILLIITLTYMAFALGAFYLASSRIISRRCFTILNNTAAGLVFGAIGVYALGRVIGWW